MKIKITQQALNSALSKLNGVIHPNTSIPALSCVLIIPSADGKGVSLVGTNIDLTVKTTADGDVSFKEGGETLLVPFNLINGVVSSASGSDLEINGTDGGMLHVKTVTGSFTIATQESKCFPVIKREDDEVKFSIPCKDLKSMLAQTSFAAAKPSENRKRLESCLISANCEEVVCVATNGKCLARVQVEADTGLDSEVEAIVPQSSVQKILRIAEGDKNAKVIISKKGSYAIFGLDGTVVKTKLVEDCYPAYRQVIPKGEGETMTVNSLSLINAVKRASVFLSSLTSQYVTLDIDPESIIVSSPATEIGTAKETVAVNGYSGERLSLSYNNEILVDALSSSMAENVTIHYHGGNSPISITDGEKYLALAMPVRVG